MSDLSLWNPGSFQRNEGNVSRCVIWEQKVPGCVQGSRWQTQGDRAPGAVASVSCTFRVFTKYRCFLRKFHASWLLSQECQPPAPLRLQNRVMRTDSCVVRRLATLSLGPTRGPCEALLRGQAGPASPRGPSAPSLSPSTARCLSCGLPPSSLISVSLASSPVSGTGTEAGCHLSPMGET